MTAVLAAASARSTADKVAVAGLGGVNRRALDLLTDAAPIARILLPVAAAVAVATLVRWARAEHRNPNANPAKWFYVGSTLVMILLVAVNPLVGFIAYVGSHAAEYFLVVHHHLEGRYRPKPKADAPTADAPKVDAPQGAEPVDVRTGPVAAVVRSRAGRTGFIAAYLGGIGAVLVGLTTAGYPYYTLFVLIAGGLHLFYDGLIWKLRRPDVGRGFGIPSAQPPGATAPG